jgi:hypothetical protein
MTNLLLSSDLKGFIENPHVYFQPDNWRWLDLLMLVQGWKRYEWQTMAGVERKVFSFDLERGLKLKGYINGKSAAVQFWAEKDSLYIEDHTPVDDKGGFAKYLADFEGRWTLSLRSEGLKNANRNIRIDRWFSPERKTYLHQQTGRFDFMSHTSSIHEEQTAANEEAFYGSISDTLEIDEVKVTAKKGKDFIYRVAEDYERYVDLEQKMEMNTNVFYYLVDKDNGFFHKTKGVYGPDNVYLSSGYSCFGKYITWPKYLDTDGKIKAMNGLVYPGSLDQRKSFGRPIEEVEKIIFELGKKKLTDIDSTVKCGCRYNVNHIIYPLAFASAKQFSDIRYTFFDGYSAVKDFYNNRIQREMSLPNKNDYPRTLYWNPNVEPDADGKSRISFYNSSFCKQIDISAEGITADGVPFYNEK